MSVLTEFLRALVMVGCNASFLAGLLQFEQ